MTHQPTGNRTHRAALVFQRFMAADDEGPPLDYAALRAIHPDLAEQLDAMHVVWHAGRAQGRVERSRNLAQAAMAGAELPAIADPVSGTAPGGAADGGWLAWLRGHRAAGVSLFAGAAVVFLFTGRLLFAMQRQQPAVAQESSIHAAMIASNREAQAGLLAAQRAERLRQLADETLRAADERQAGADQTAAMAEDRAAAADQRARQAELSAARAAQALREKRADAEQCAADAAKRAAAAEVRAAAIAQDLERAQAALVAQTARADGLQHARDALAAHLELAQARADHAQAAAAAIDSMLRDSASALRLEVQAATDRVERVTLERDQARQRLIELAAQAAPAVPAAPAAPARSRPRYTWF